MFILPEIIARADNYASIKKIELLGLLGAGKDGTVWRTNRATALKIHVLDSSYRNERNAYMRLTDCKVKEVAGFSVPRLVDHDDALFAIEMTAVTPPYVLDFASAIFDEPPDFLEDERHTFDDFIRDRFDEKADKVLDIYYELVARAAFTCRICIRRM